MLPLKCAAFFTTPQGPSWGSAPPSWTLSGGVSSPHKFYRLQRGARDRTCFLSALVPLHKCLKYLTLDESLILDW